MMPSPTAMFAFGLPTQQSLSTESSTQDVNSYHAPQRYYVQDESSSGSGTMTDMERARMTCDPDLQSPGTFLEIDSQRLQPSQKGNKTFLTLLPPSYPTMTDPSSVDGNHSKTSAQQHMQRSHNPPHLPNAGIMWPHPQELQAYAQDQLHSAPVSAENSLQTFQSQPSRLYHSSIPPATAPLTVSNANNAFPYLPSQFPIFQANAPGPLQLQQQSMYTPTSSANDPNSAAAHTHWFQNQPPSTAPPAMRRSLQHVHSVPSVPTSAAFSPLATQQVSGSGSGSGYPRQRTFAEQQQQFNVPSMMQQQTPGGPTAPMMVRESARDLVHSGVYDASALVPSSVDDHGTGKSSKPPSRIDEVQGRSRGQEESSDDDHEDDGQTSKEIIAYTEGRLDHKSVRPRRSDTRPSRKSSARAAANGDNEKDGETDRPRKRSKRQDRSAEQADEVVPVKANGKGNQFILTLYAMVEAPSSYPLIGWNLPGTAIVIPDSKAFATAMLNKYFRHSTISSFARQLVSYGFLKTELPARERAMVQSSIRTDSKHWTFSHDFFLRGRADLLDQVEPLVSPGRPQRGPAKRSVAAMRREEDAFMDVLKRENTHWRERCERLEQCMLEEKVRANQYLAVLMERGIIASGQPFPPAGPMQVMIANPPSSQPFQQSSEQARLEDASKDKSPAQEFGQLPEADGDSAKIREVPDEGHGEVYESG